MSKEDPTMNVVLQEVKAADGDQLRVYARNNHSHTVSVYSVRVVATPHNCWTLEPLESTGQDTVVIPLAAVTDVFVGKQRDVFCDAAVRPLLAECCFSVIFVSTPTASTATTAQQQHQHEFHLVANSAAKRAYFLSQLQRSVHRSCAQPTAVPGKVGPEETATPLPEQFTAPTTLETSLVELTQEGQAVCATVERPRDSLVETHDKRAVVGNSSNNAPYGGVFELLRWGSLMSWF